MLLTAEQRIALNIAITAMDREIDALTPEASNYRHFGEALVINRIEARRAAQRCSELTHAITLIEALLAEQGTGGVT